jgi:type VI secretion system protein ImpH
MAPPIRQTNSDVALARLPDRLRNRPSDFSFYQAVRLLEQIYGCAEPLGAFSHPSAEPVRLSTHSSLAFPPAEIDSIEERTDAPPRMTVNFFGLVGPMGTLPTRYSELVNDRLAARDSTLRDFLDIFNHRLISLLYRAWEKYRFPVAYGRGGTDPIQGYLLNLIGLGSEGLRDRQPFPDQALIGYEGLLAQFPRSASALCQILRHYFDIPVELEPFAGGWRPLEPDSRTSLESQRTPSEQLGVGFVLGDEVWDQQTVVRLRLGPMPLAQFKGFLPDGDAYESLRCLCRFFCGEDLDVEAQLILLRGDTPRFGLDIDGAQPPRLGWLSWSFSEPLSRDPDETLLRLWTT